jgi:hypothetical protein
MSLVFPGVPDILASFRRLQSIFRSDDFPTLERPMNAYSGLLGAGQSFGLALLVRNDASVIRIFFCKNMMFFGLIIKFLCKRMRNRFLSVGLIHTFKGMFGGFFAWAGH